jgi:hypothetical protein
MQNGPKTMMSAQRPRSTTPIAARSNRWPSRNVRPELKGSQNSQRSHERYLVAENYYQHAEHYFRSMSSGRGPA